MSYEPLTREQVIEAVEGGHPPRIPLVRAKWWGEGLREQYGNALDRFEPVPEDVAQLWMPNPGRAADLGLSWSWDTGGGHDARVVIDDWRRLDEYIAKLPNPRQDQRLMAMIPQARAAREAGMYVQLAFWNFFFELPWSLRGMANIMMDYYTATDEVHRLHRALADCYMAYIETAAEWFQPDSFWTSDDLGHQTGPMMSPKIFHELLYPYYADVIGAAHAHDMHVWLHSCGDNGLLMPDLVAAGLDVFHPVQKHTMDEIETMERFGGQLAFLVGIDVQHTLQELDPAGVREEVRFLIDTFDRPDGRMCLAAGNGIVAGTPIENIAAFLDEALRYGTEHRQRYQ